MIPGYSDHAANERTFLAWVRTGVAVIAFGFVVEKFNLFLVEIANASIEVGGRQVHPAAFHTGPFGRYDGTALILVGLATVLIASFRFVRTSRMLDDGEVHSAAGVRPEVVLSAVLAVLVAAISAYLVIG
jgi:putative membrane protein